MNKKIDKFKAVVIILLIIETLAIAGIIVFLAMNGGSSASESGGMLQYEYAGNGKYVLYIGLNDKDT